MESVERLCTIAPRLDGSPRARLDYWERSAWEVTYLPEERLQPTGPQAAAVDPESVPLVPKSEKAFRTFRLPHSGHSGSATELKERSHFSNFAPHS
jgi:hypothetical protein